MNTYEVTYTKERVFTLQSIDEEDAIIIVQQNSNKLSSRDSFSFKARRLK